jgi:uncharacterized protein (DUF488 family)
VSNPSSASPPRPAPPVPPVPPAPPIIYTIGHSNHSAEVFLAQLRRHGIAAIVDVRSAPYSRFSPHFNRRDLEHLVTTAGIGYHFAGESLGGRPTDPTCYKNGVVPDGHADYLELVDYIAVAERDWYRRGIARLRQLAAEKPIALMCSEEDPGHCHRHHLIAQTLLTDGIAVRHIRASGEIEDATVEAPPARQLGLL